MTKYTPKLLLIVEFIEHYLFFLSMTSQTQWNLSYTILNGEFNQLLSCSGSCTEQVLTQKYSFLAPKAVTSSTVTGRL